MVSIVPLIQHHIARAAAGEPYNAIENCHAPDLHSIVLHDQPGNRLRIFYADWNHNLHRNKSGKFSIAIHSHHCALRFIGLFGGATNDVYAITPHSAGAFGEMRYQSAITTGAGSLIPTGKRAGVHLLRSERLTSNPKLAAHELHTIHAESGARSAWLVIEGAEDPSYESVCWSNDPKPDFAGLYKPVDSERVSYLLTEILRQTERPTA
jgi:hypothetical protein